ncbi:MAG: homoserine dehydrogenase [Ruminococcus sp.]|jgi:homoserine dehydrogenase|nr:homoserine dehydrogenase [Ruminococcus sp.]
MKNKFAVLGFGVVGSGVCELFYKNKYLIERKVGAELDLHKILDIRDFQNSPYSGKFTKDINDILNDKSIDIVCECMGGLEPAFTFVKNCLEVGKSVVTSNKELVAMRGDVLLKIAKTNGCNFFFEASVGGSIPIIKPLVNDLGANEISQVAGILNGTTNFILTKMKNENYSFDDALKLAQELGYAERDPSADISGLDANRKICILSSILSGKHIYPDWVKTLGIENITLNDINEVSEIGTIKLIAFSKIKDGKIYSFVSPMIVLLSNILSKVEDVYNAVMVYGDATGKTLFYGKGAGKLPTASAVLSDLIDAAKLTGNDTACFWEHFSDENFLSDPAELGFKLWKNKLPILE